MMVEEASHEIYIICGEGGGSYGEGQKKLCRHNDNVMAGEKFK